MSELIPLIEKAMINFSLSNRGDGVGHGSSKSGGVVQPLRETVPIRERDAFLFTMPAYSGVDGVLATKLVTLFPRNKDVPTHHGVIVLMSADNGSVLSFLDAEVITEMRTAAASAVATKYLAASSSSCPSLKLGVVGSGVQARGHVRALRHVRDFSEIRVWSPDPRKVRDFVEEFRNEAAASAGDGASSSSTPFIACGSAAETVADADVIVTATLAREPILFRQWVKPGAHINAVGAPRPDQRELDGELVRSSHVVVDSLEGALVEAGDLIINEAQDRIVGELGAVATMTEDERRKLLKGGEDGQPECCGKETTIFKNLGMAIQDAVAAKYVYDKVIGSGRM